MSHGPGFIGCIHVSPPLNDEEMDFLEDLADSDRTLRGTPTGRGDTDVPFARMAWQPCLDGCCLTWDGSEATKMMAPTLRFLVDHLLRPGAKAAGHRRFPDFTCDHVLDGTVAGRGYDDALGRTVVVADNQVSEHELPEPCEPPEPRTRPDDSGHAGHRGARPANVIEFRPRRA